VDDADRPQFDAEDGFLVSKKLLIHDRDPLFTAGFRDTLAAAGVQSVRLPARSPSPCTSKTTIIQQCGRIAPQRLRRPAGSPSRAKVL